jgi:regulator of protease activity HflC (stomatin/prohibitin superfamily)
VLLLFAGLIAKYAMYQWVLTVMVGAVWMLCNLLPFPIGLAYVLGSVVLGFGIGALALVPLYGGNLISAIEAAISLLLGEPVSTQVVIPPPKIVDPNPPRRVGPAQLVINPNAVAVIENGAKQTAIYGPGLFTTKPFEYTQAIYDLRPQHHRMDFSNVLTQDLISTNVSVGVTYGIDVAWEAREGMRPLLSNERYAIQAFHVRAVNWETELNTVLESAVRSVLGNRRFEHATAADHRQAVETEISGSVQKTAAEWGIMVHSTRLVSVQPTAHVTSAREKRFISDTDAETLGRYELARAQAWSDALIVLGDAYAYAKDNKVPDMIIVRELLRRLMEQGSSQAATQNMFPRELRHLFDELQDGVPGSPNGTAGGASIQGP